MKSVSSLHRLLFAVLVGTSWLAPGSPSHGEAGAQEAPRPGEAANEQVPTPLEITSRYQTLADSAARVEREISARADTVALASELRDMAARNAELRERVAAVAATEYIRPERISRVRDQALAHEQDLSNLHSRASQRLGFLAEIRAEWTERRRTWSTWAQELAGEPEASLVETELDAARADVEAVLGRIAELTPPLLDLRREVEALRSETRAIGEELAAIRAGRREALVRRAEPLLFSARFAADLSEALDEPSRPLDAIRPAAFAGFLRDNAGLVLLHLLLGLGVALLARRFRGGVERDGAWSEMLRHPVALAVFASTAVMGWRYVLPPALWELVMWILLAASGTVLANRLLQTRTLRLVVYFFAAFYPLFLLVEAMQLAPPLFRIGLVAVAALGAAFFGWLTWRAGRRPGQRHLQWVLAVAALIWGVVLLAEILGFYLLARWILHATVTSALIVFTVLFLIALARGATRTLLQREAAGRPRFLRRAAVPLAERLVLVIQAVIVVGAALTLLDIWEIAPSPGETWSRIVGAGVTIAGIEITVGRVLTAFVVVYLAVFASWLVRTFVDSEAAPRWGVDPGVGNSITTLVHYSLIVLGVLLALGVVGVELQSFVIVAGALGVGIGFGLQNIVNNFVSGLILLFERPIRVGDTVVLDGEWGTVEKIGLRSTVVLTFDRSELIVPNAQLVSETVTNWTLSNPVARLIVPVGVAYGSDVEAVLRILKEAAADCPHALDDPEPVVLFVAFGGSSLDFEVRVWLDELRVRLDARSALLADIDRRFREAGIEIPFPQRDLHVRSVDRELVDSAFGRDEARRDGGADGGTAAARSGTEKERAERGGD